MEMDRNTSVGPSAIPAANDTKSLRDETGNRVVPKAEFAFGDSQAATPVAAKDAANGGIRSSSAHRLVSQNDTTLVSCREHELVDLLKAPISYISSPHEYQSEIRNGAEIAQERTDMDMHITRFTSRADYDEAHRHTIEAIDYYLAWGSEFRGLAPATIRKRRGYLDRLFNTELIYDLGIGCSRCFTVPDLMQPGHGKKLVLTLHECLTDDLGLEDVALDLLAELRPFLRFIADGGAVLPSGVNLVDRWGALVSPIANGDIRKRKPKSEVFLPRPEQMLPIYKEIADWADGGRRKATAARAAALLIGALCTGMRGAELRNLRLDDQFENRLTNPFAVHSAKGGDPRLVTADEFGHAYISWYIDAWRPSLTSDRDGYVFPAAGGARMSNAAFSTTTGILLKHLKQVGLLHEAFTFHSARKTYATHFVLKHGGKAVDALLAQCGWKNEGQLKVYIKPPQDAIELQRLRWTQMLGLRARNGRRRAA